jgi:ABC-type glycerol-3-phosphate transport system substrate-binding protein
MDLLNKVAGIDAQVLFPAGGTASDADEWTWERFLAAGEKCAKVGYPFGLPLGTSPDSNMWVAGLFGSFGAALVDANGAVTVNSDNVKHALDYARRLAPFLPPDVYSWDDASNNRALISGKSALIINPPSAWAGALKDNPPVAEQIWHHPLPSGEHGRFVPSVMSFWGVWRFSRNKTAAKELILWLSEREQAEALSVATSGYQLPPFPSMSDFLVWTEAAPPKGTLYNYPVKPQHRSDPTVPGWPAPPAIATQIAAQAMMPKMIARVTQNGMSIEQSIALVERELQGFIR